MEGGESFPLLDPEPVKESSYRQHQDPQILVNRVHSKEQKSSIGEPFSKSHVPATKGDEEESDIDARNPYLTDCPTCQKNWDLLNRSQVQTKPEQAPVRSDGEQKTMPSTTARLSELNAACLSFDLDGLLPSVDRQQVRLGQILAAKDVCYSVHCLLFVFFYYRFLCFYQLFRL